MQLNFLQLFYSDFIGIHAYHELIKIIHHLNFKADQVPYSVTTLKKIRKGLPLLPFTGKFIPIDLKSIPLKETYNFSIKSHIQRIINNPMLMSKMYFGPGVEKEKIRKYGMDIYGKNLRYLAKYQSQ